MDEFIVHLDDILFPMDSGHGRFNEVQQWLSKPGNQKLIRSVMSSRQTTKRERGFCTIATTLRWTGLDRHIPKFLPNDDRLRLLDHEIGPLKCSALPLTPFPSTKLSPMAQVVLNLNKFFTMHFLDFARPQDSRMVCDVVSSPALHAKGQLFILEKLFFSVVCLIDRFHQTILPVRIMCLELAQKAQNSNVARLLKRDADGWSYLDDEAFMNNPRFLTVREGLQSYLLDILTDHQKLDKATELLETKDRIGFVKRLLVMAICLCCSQDPTTEAFWSGIRSLHRFPAICDHTDLQELRTAFAFLDPDRKEANYIVASFAQVANSLGDPLRVLVDPVTWKDGEDIPLGTHYPIFPVYIRVLGGRIETSASHLFGIVDRDCYTLNVGSTDQFDLAHFDEGISEDLVADAHDFKATEPHIELAELNPVVLRYLLCWRIQHWATPESTRRLDEKVQKLAGHLTGTDRAIFRHIIQLKLPINLHKVVYGGVIEALAKLAQSSYPAGLEVLLWANGNPHLLKQVLQGLDRGSPFQWKKAYRAGIEAVTSPVNEFRALLKLDQGAYPNPSLLTAKAEGVAAAVAMFDREHRSTIQGIRKKQAKQGP